MGSRLEDEVAKLKAELDAFLATRLPQREPELEDWQREALGHLAAGERVPDELLEGKGLSGEFVRTLEEMVEEGYFDQLLGDECEEG